MMTLFTDTTFLGHLVAALVFALIGLIFFAVAFVIMVKATPFSVRKEIEDDQNVALAIIIGSVIIGIALIIGMAIQG
jgi:uncharacterized membrane protein YjfL (UPF0719 family)